MLKTYGNEILLFETYILKKKTPMRDWYRRRDHIKI